VTAIEVRSLSVSYGSTAVLEDVDLSVPVGEGLCLTGENGIGKSTLLRCVSGLQKPDAGEIEIFGGPPGSTPEFWRAVATTVEPPTWYPGLTAREHAELIRRAHAPKTSAHTTKTNAHAAGADADTAEADVDAMFERFGIASHADAIPPSLSSGQKQRLTLALVFLRPSRLLILDEPEQRLDAEGRATVAELIAGYLAGGGSVLMASHDEAFVAASGTRTVEMAQL
jgi:ABC-2 type transport system ATP-binding protein